MIDNEESATPTIVEVVPPPPPKGAVILRATAGEVVGAGMRVGGLSVVERSLKQMDRMGLSVVVASDGSCPLPKYLPPTALLRKVPRPDEMEALRRELAGVPEVGADEVRPASGSLDGGIKVVDETSRRKAETAVFAELLRGDLGFVARYLNKPISFLITRHLLCRLPVTPNQVTLGAALVGLFGAALLATGNSALMLWGFFAIQVQSILDGCDGELARVRFQQSALGEWLDTLVDDGLHILIFAALGIGFHRATGSNLYLSAGLVASLMHIAYDVVALTEIRRQGEGSETLKLRWRLTGGDDMKTRLNKKGKSLTVILYTMGRRDFFVLAFLVYALLGIPKLTLVHALLIAGSLFVIAVWQVVWRLRGSPET
ncbi:MAG: CDP-alcohol phosphatidyltransferase family protein [Deltaproteobacteria bacterium]|nr:CDP-alcohol phosphatidyltransferase family protein [Deltaproteobacteria bacterium]